MIRGSLTLVGENCSYEFSGSIVQTSPPFAGEVTMTLSHTVTTVSSNSTGEGPSHIVSERSDIMAQFFLNKKEKYSENRRAESQRLGYPTSHHFKHQLWYWSPSEWWWALILFIICHFPKQAATIAPSVY